MGDLTFSRPEDCGFDPARLQRAFDLLEGWAAKGQIPGATLCVGRRGRVVEPRFLGRLGPEPKGPALPRDSLFLIASITKPVVVGGVMLLVERGRLTLDDRVAAHVPRFAANGKEEVRIRHLMTHTSGLPDMLPNNDRLRSTHQPLSAFVDEVCRLKLEFPPGTRVQYQSMGIAMLAEVIHQVTGMTTAEFLRREVFQPLGMTETSLGWQPELKGRIAAIRISAEAAKTDWNWNTPYWLGFGAPWGGLITSPRDFAKYCLMMLGDGALGKVRIFSPATIRAMTMNQLASLPAVPEEERRCRPWGLGWRLNWPGHSANFGDLLGPRTYGHWGATGTLCWLDPETQAFCILFTTQPQEPEGRFLARVSNVVAASLV